MRQKESREERERREALELAIETGTVGILNSVGVVVVRTGLTMIEPKGGVKPPKENNK